MQSKAHYQPTPPCSRYMRTLGSYNHFLLDSDRQNNPISTKYEDEQEMAKLMSRMSQVGSFFSILPIQVEYTAIASDRAPPLSLDGSCSLFADGSLSSTARISHRLSYRGWDPPQMPIRKVQFCSESVTQQQPVSSLQFHLQTSNKPSYSPCIVRKTREISSIPLFNYNPRWSCVLSFIGTCLETLQKRFPELFGEPFLQRFEARDCYYFVASEDLAD